MHITELDVINATPYREKLSRKNLSVTVNCNGTPFVETAGVELPSVPRQRPLDSDLEADHTHAEPTQTWPDMSLSYRLTCVKYSQTMA